MRKRKDKLPYSKWAKANLSELQTARLLDAGAARVPDETWINGRYEVWVYRNMKYGDSWPWMHWLAIKRRDKEPIRSWRDLQRIKNDIIGDEYEAVEIFPAESRLVDTSNQYHLFVLTDKTLRFPFGYIDRAVVDEHSDGSKQAEWEKKPDDTITAEESNKRVEEAERKKLERHGIKYES